MKNTKNKIKDAARLLFNEQGLADTSLRNIAMKLGISQGNLNYHYKTKQDLVEALYHELVHKMDQQMEQLTKSLPIMVLLHESSLQSLTIFYEYRFLLQDLFKICRENESIRLHYTSLQGQRKRQFLFLFDQLIQSGDMREAVYEEEYEELYLRMQIIGDNWINTQIVLYSDLPNPVTYFHRVLLGMLYPYLTEKGQQSYLEQLKLG